MNKVFLLVLLASLAFASQPAPAADKVVVVPLYTSQSGIGWLNLNPSSASFSQGAYFSIQAGEIAGITLPDTDSPNFGLGFTIPPDFRNGTALTIHMVWNIAATGCTVNFQPLALSVARPGRAHLTGPLVIAGLSIVGGSILQAPPVVDQPTETLITITSPEDGTDLEAGDSVIFGFMRWPWHPDDTCNGVPMRIHGLSVTYQKK